MVLMTKQSRMLHRLDYPMPLRHQEPHFTRFPLPGVVLPSLLAEEAIERILSSQKAMWKQIALCDRTKHREIEQRACMTGPSIAKVKAAQAALLQALLEAEWEAGAVAD